ncbi:MAG: hypothetical protein FWH20_10390 [Oscillospiraceae bacterium]|nr:hypothetical protein [Oscillospiraceae bacterium]
MKTTKIFAYIVIAAILLTFAGCKNDGDNSDDVPGNVTGNAAGNVTDLPAAPPEIIDEPTDNSGDTDLADNSSDTDLADNSGDTDLADNSGDTDPADNSGDTDPAEPDTATDNPTATFEYLGETFSLDDADSVEYYQDGRLAVATFLGFGYIWTVDGLAKVTLGQEIDGLIVTRADVIFDYDFSTQTVLSPDTDVILEGEIEFTGRLYKERDSIAVESGFHVTETLRDTVIPFENVYNGFFCWGDYDPESEHPDIFANGEYADVTATFGTVRLRVTSRATGGNFIELTGVTEIH